MIDIDDCDQVYGAESDEDGLDEFSDVASPKLRRPATPRDDQEVTVERLERALVMCAYCITLDGPVYAPIFDRLEREIEMRKRASDPVARAQQILAAYTVEGGRRAIR